MEKLAVSIIACTLSGSFVMAILDSNFRNDFSEIATASITALPQLIKDGNKKDEKKKKDKQ